MKGWSWREGRELDGKWVLRLLTPDGRAAASIYEGVGPTGGAIRQPREQWRPNGALHGWYWSTWDPEGTGGENSREMSLEDAKWCADRAARVWWYEKGWADPTSRPTR